MNNSVFWARLLGLYSTILAVWCFHDINHLYSILTDLSNNPLMLMCFGTFTILIGLAVLVSHSIYKGWPIIVTIVGYMITIKGIILLFFPHWLSGIVVFWQDKNILFAPIPALLLGLVLLYFGFVRKTV